MREIKLTQGYYALVDDEDYEALVKFHWSAIKSGGRVYAHRRGRNGETSTVRMHRQIMNAEKGAVIDHINRNTLDNQRANLRFCTHAENMRNTGSRNSAKTSYYKGVHYDTANRYWVSQIQIEEQKKHLGYFNREIEAATAYNIAARKFFGEFAVVNQILEVPINRRKKKYATGAENRAAKLTENEVRYIRSCRSASKVLAAKFGVCVSTINRIRSGVIWRGIL